MSGGVSAAPNPPPARGKLAASARSLAGIQFAIARLNPGHAAASPIPRQNLVTPSVTTTGNNVTGSTFKIMALSAVNTDHHNSAALSTPLGPKRSANQPPGN